MRFIAYFHARRDALIDCRVQLFKLHVLLFKLYDLHSAANINADHIGNRLVFYSHSSAYRARLTRMHVGHDAYPAVFKNRIIAHRLNLLYGGRFDDVGIYLCRIKFTFNNFGHDLYLLKNRLAFILLSKLTVIAPLSALFLLQVRRPFLPDRENSTYTCFERPAPQSFLYSLYRQAAQLRIVQKIFYNLSSQRP